MSFTSFFHLILHSCLFGENNTSQRNIIHNFSQCNMLFSSKEITLDLAITKAERELGLSYRKKLHNNEGMLFYFDESSQISFHSHTISFEICIVFLDSKKNILHSQVLPPNRQIVSPINSHYALELSANHCSEIKKVESLPLCDRD